ncbi:MAG: hypothetical protein ACM3NV_09635 [Syntrophothermus sp.]
MRIVAALTLSLLVAVSAPATAGSGPRVVAKPGAVRYGQRLTIQGGGWPVIEFCSREMRVLLERGQRGLRIGTTRVGRMGRFALTYVPRRREVGAGRWTVIARLRCESGKTGAPSFVQRSDTVLIGRPST